MCLPRGRGSPRPRRSQDRRAVSAPGSSRPQPRTWSATASKSAACRSPSPAPSGPQPELVLLDEVFLACARQLAGADPRRAGDHERQAQPPGRAGHAPSGRHLQPGQALAAAETIRGTRRAGDDRKRHDSDLRSAQESLEHAHAARHQSDVQARRLRAQAGTSSSTSRARWWPTRFSASSWRAHRTHRAAVGRCSGTVDGCDISPELRNSLPEQIRGPLEPLGVAAGAGRFQLSPGQRRHGTSRRSSRSTARGARPHRGSPAPLRG